MLRTVLAALLAIAFPVSATQVDAIQAALTLWERGTAGPYPDEAYIDREIIVARVHSEDCMGETSSASWRDLDFRNSQQITNTNKRGYSYVVIPCRNTSLRCVSHAHGTHVWNARHTCRGSRNVPTTYTSYTSDNFYLDSRPHPLSDQIRRRLVTSHWSN
jgi:hypothetical protein